MRYLADDASLVAEASTERQTGYSRRHFLSSLGLAGLAFVGTQTLRIPGAFAASANSSTPQVTPTTTAATTPLTAVGLYAGGWDYLSNRAGVQTLGCTALRTTPSGMTSQAWQAMQADGQNVHLTVSGTDRSKFSSDAAFIASYLSSLDSALTQWPARWVEIWNEPNFGMWKGAKAAQKQALYGNLLVAAYAHVKANYPGTGVVGFGAGDASAAGPGFIKGVLTAVPAAAQSFDVCSMHPYFGNSAPEAVRTEAWGSWTIASQVAAVRKLGVTAPIWFTETGWAISKVDGGKFAQSPSSTVSPALQAAYRVRMYVLSMKLGVQRLNHMYVTDTDNYNGGFFCGKSARPQAIAFAQQQRMIGAATTFAPLVEGPDVWAYVLGTPTRDVITAWSDSGTTLPGLQGVDLSSGSDMYGNPLVVSQGCLTLSSAPMYLPVQPGVTPTLQPSAGSSTSRTPSGTSGGKDDRGPKQHRPKPSHRRPHPERHHHDGASHREQRSGSRHQHRHRDERHHDNHHHHKHHHDGARKP